MSTTSVGGAGRLVIGLLLVVVGGFLLLNQVFNIDLFSIAWPLFVIVPGVVMLAVAVSGGKHTHPLAIPGSIVTAVGLILFVQQLFDVYASWAYAWALVTPTAVGFGIWLSALLEGNQKGRTSGIHVMEIGAILFAAGFVFFELILNLNGMVNQTTAAIVGGLMLIAGGGILIGWSLTRSRGGTGATS